MTNRVRLIDWRPELLGEWDYVKNGDTDITTITKGSQKVYWWVCELGHSFDAEVKSRSRGQNCPFCAGRRILKGFNDLATTCPALSTEWADISLGPDEVTKSSHAKVLWKCALGHTYKMVVGNRVHNNQGCPYCWGAKVLPGFNDLATTDPEIADELYDEEYSKTTLTRSSNKIVRWQCTEGHLWKTSVNNRTKGTKCPRCLEIHTSNIEKRLRNLVRNRITGFSFDPEIARVTVFSDNKSKKLSVDILGVSDTVKLVIEYDGSYWHRNKFDKDSSKTMLLLSNGFKVVRIREQSRAMTLDFLDICHPNLLQLKVDFSRNDTNLSELLPEIQNWLSSKDKNLEELK